MNYEPNKEDVPNNLKACALRCSLRGVPDDTLISIHCTPPATEATKGGHTLKVQHRTVWRVSDKDIKYVRSSSCVYT